MYSLQDTDVAETICTDDLNTDNWELYSAVKVDVSEVSVVSDYKVLVVSHDSTARDVIHSLLKKLRMKEFNSHTFVIQAELLSQTEIAVLQFEDNDKLMHAYNQFPKGSLSFYLRRKMETSEKVKRDADKASLNGHQLTIQRIRRSLEKLKRKSTAVTGEKLSSGQSKDGQPVGTGRTEPEGRGGQSRDGQPVGTGKKGPEGRGGQSRDGQPLATARTGPEGRVEDTETHLIKADELYKEPRREHRGRQGRVRKHQSDVTTPRSEKKLLSSESIHRGEHRLQHTSSQKTSQPSLRSESMYQFQESTYKTTTLPQGGTMVSMDTDCMIFYDNNSDAGSIHSMPVTMAHNPARTHVMPHLNHKSDFNLNKHAVMIDKPKKMSFRNLEDSGIDVKSPPQTGHYNGLPLTSGQSSIRDRHSKVSTCDAEVMSPLNSQNSYLSPTLSDSSPFSLSGDTDGLVKRSGSFSSMKSLPVTIYKDNTTPNSFTFETIDDRDDLRSKSQSCTNLTRNKVVRRRSLPPLDVSQAKLEQKKTSLSKRLARKINRYRENEKRYSALPSPHSFTPQSPKRDQKQTDPDDLSLADMEVAHILEGKPEHPTDSDVEDYLACVESAEPHSPSKSSAHPKSTVQHSKQHTTAPQQEHMEKSGYYRYRNSAKLERQQKQETTELDQPDHNNSDTVKDNAGNHKPASLNKFVDQSMKSFLHHCHDINMVSKHDTLELHQAALHGVLPTSPSSKPEKPSKTHSPNKSTEHHGPVKTSGNDSPTKTHSPTKSTEHHSPAKSLAGSYSSIKGHTYTNSVRPTDPQSPTKAEPQHSSSKITSAQSFTEPITHGSSFRSLSHSSTKSSVPQSPTEPSLPQSPTKASVPQTPTKPSVPQSLFKPSLQSPTKSSEPLIPNRFRGPLSLSQGDYHLSNTKVTNSNSPTRTPVIHSPTVPHNSTKASGYSRSTPIKHDSHGRSSGHQDKEDSSSKEENYRTEVQITTTHQSKHIVSNKASVDSSDSARHMYTTAQKYTVCDKPSTNWSRMYGAEDDDDDELQNMHSQHWQQGRMSDVPDGPLMVPLGSPSKGGQVSSNTYDNLKTPKNINAFKSIANSSTGKSDIDVMKLYGETQPNTDTVNETPAKSHRSETQNKAIHSQYIDSSLHSALPQTVKENQGHSVENSVKSEVQTSMSSTSLGRGVSCIQDSGEVTLDPVKEFEGTWRGRRGSHTSDSTSQSSRERGPHQEDGEEIAPNPLSLFSLALSHSLWSVYLEKPAGQSYGLRVRRGEFRVGRQAWHVEEIPVYTVVQLTELLPQSPAQATKGRLLPGDIIVEVNGHSVLQSSDKVVCTLLDARPSLELVVARPRHRDQTGDSLDILDLTFDNMDQIPTDATANSDMSSTGHPNHCTSSNMYSIGHPNLCTSSDLRTERSKVYQTISAEIAKSQQSGVGVNSHRTNKYGVEGATFLL